MTTNTTTNTKSNDSVFFHHNSDKWQPNMVMVNAHTCALTTMVTHIGNPYGFTILVNVHDVNVHVTPAIPV